MKIFLVGGAVRDTLLGIIPRDRDFVIIDSSHEELIEQGFLPVGSHYQVYLHPKSREEYALAENLTADLARRDLTMNAMAMDEQGELIDPFGGQADLKNKILKHTSQHFSDDPLRVYRVAKFKARYPDFRIAEETKRLMCEMAKLDVFKTLFGERILGELGNALNSQKPSAFFEVLLEVHALKVHFKEIMTWAGLDEIETIAKLRFAYLMETLSLNDVDQLSKRLMVSNEWLELGEASSRIYKDFILPFPDLSPLEIVNVFYKIDAFRKPYLVELLSQLHSSQGQELLKYFERLQEIKAKDAPSELRGEAIGRWIFTRRIEALGSAQN